MANQLTARNSNAYLIKNLDLHGKSMSKEKQKNLWMMMPHQRSHQGVIFSTMLRNIYHYIYVLLLNPSTSNLTSSLFTILLSWAKPKPRKKVVENLRQGNPSQNGSTFIKSKAKDQVKTTILSRNAKQISDWYWWSG